MNIERRSLINELVFVRADLLKRNVPEPYVIQMTQKTYRRLLDELQFVVFDPSNKKPTVLGMHIEVIE